MRNHMKASKGSEEGKWEMTLSGVNSSPSSPVHGGLQNVLFILWWASVQAFVYNGACRLSGVGHLLLYKNHDCVKTALEIKSLSNYIQIKK